MPFKAINRLIVELSSESTCMVIWWMARKEATYRYKYFSYLLNTKIVWFEKISNKNTLISAIKKASNMNIGMHTDL